MGSGTTGGEYTVLQRTKYGLLKIRRHELGRALHVPVGVSKVIIAINQKHTKKRSDVTVD